MSKPETAAAWQAPLLDLAWSLARRRLMIVGALLLGLVAGVIGYLRSPPTYRATADAVLLPRDKPTVDLVVTASSMETSEDSARRADSGSLMLPAEPELYIALMRSRSVLESVAAELGDRLVEQSPVNDDDRSDEIVARLRSLLKISGSEEGMLSVTATAEDPGLAADVANLIVAKAQLASKEIERQLLLQQAAYLSDTVASTSRHLESTEAELEAFHQRHDLVDPQAHAGEQRRQVRELTAVRDGRRRALAALLVSHTEADPAVRSLRAEIRQAEASIREVLGRGAGGPSESEYGRLSIEYRGLVEELRFRRDLLATLSTQADVFRIRAEQPAGNIAVVRPAVPPLRRAGPSKKRTLGLALACSLVLAVAACLLLDQLESIRRDERLSGRYEQLRDELLRPLRLPEAPAARRSPP